MYIDLDDEASRFLVQEYVNRICYYASEEELNYNLHKLIHTFDVANMAQRLIDLTQPALPEKLKKQILNAAILHDVGRCYEFKKGKHVKIDHGKVGSNLIKKHLPDMEIEAQSTLFHNKCPSNKDPKSCQPVLDYVRDADILANIKYEIEKTKMWLTHIIGKEKARLMNASFDPELLQAVKEGRPANSAKLNIHSLLTGWLWQLCWYYNLKTKAAFKIAKKEKLFPKLRNTICQKIVPLVTQDTTKRKELIQQIQEIFPDKMFK